MAGHGPISVVPNIPRAIGSAISHRFRRCLFFAPFVRDQSGTVPITVLNAVGPNSPLAVGGHNQAPTRTPARGVVLPGSTTRGCTARG